MARVRQARPCWAHRADGQPCQAFAVLGSRVCTAHGGRAPQVQSAAHQRLIVENTRRELGAALERWWQERAEWHTQRIAETAQLIGIDPAKVTPLLIGWCRAEYGRPAGPETAPRPRFDGQSLAGRGTQ